MQAADLEKLTTAEKLQAMELLWDALCQDIAHPVPSPEWHAHTLAERSHVEQPTSDWEDAKTRILNKTQHR